MRMRIITGTVLLLAVAGCGSGGSAADTPTTRTGVAVTMVEPSATPATQPETTPPTTEPATTEPEPTTDAAPVCGGATHLEGDKCVADTTTTVDVAGEADLNVLVTGANITADKPQFAGILTGLSTSIDSVDLVDWVVEDGLPPTAVLKVAVTSGYNGIEYRDEIAWTVYRAMATFWEADSGFRNEAGTVKPGLILTVDTTTYLAPMELMIQVADLGITQTDFLNFARQG